MSDVYRIKDSKQIVYAIGAKGQNHTMVLFPFAKESKKGYRGVVQSVRNDKLILEKTYGYG